jgi:nucleoside-diphosphate kinase
MEKTERTLSIVKPDAVEKGSAGAILARIEASGLKILALKMIQLTERQARGFYAVHKSRPFFDSLVKFMTSGPVVVSVLEGPDAIARYRKLMGATDPAKAEPGTLRKDFASDIERNAVHGSDGPATARIEIPFFFDSGEIQGLVEALPD